MIIGQRGRPRDRRRWLPMVLLLAGWFWLVSVPAAAHDTLRSSSPADASTVATTPDSIVLTFDQPALALGTRLEVTGPDGPVQTGEPRLVDSTVTQALRPGSPAGDYTVTWRVTSADGHPISGTFTFIATAANASTAAPASAEPTTPSAPAPTLGIRWEWVVLAIWLVVVGLVIRREVRRRDAHRAPSD